MTHEFQCEWVTVSSGTRLPSYSTRRVGGRCERKATYFGGSKYFCTQHAKEPATVLRKATGKIRAGLMKLEA